MRPRFRTQSECPTACRDAFGGVKTLFVAFPAYRRLSLSHVEQKFAEHVQGFIAAIAPDQRRYAERVCRCWASAWSQIDHVEVFPHRPGDLELELRRRYWRLDYLPPPDDSGVSTALSRGKEKRAPAKQDNPKRMTSLLRKEIENRRSSKPNRSVRSAWSVAKRIELRSGLAFS
jgi:hypothetical protein